MTALAKWLAFLTLLTVLGLGAVLVRPARHQPPRLVVLLVVDQLRTDYIERFRDLYQGGLDWLLERGAYFPRAAYRHSATVTSAGHATISTGMPPSRHGIVANSWWDSDRGSVYSVGDDRYPAVGGPGESRSPRALQVDTLGDRLKAQHSGARVYAVSTKDRSAILMAGKRADGAFWFEPDCGCLVSSSYYGDALPEWMAEFNATGPATPYAGRTWNRLLDDTELYERMSRIDGFPAEHDGGETAFPHPRPTEGYESTLARTPFSDEITLGAAIAALRSGALGTDSEPDLLAIGLSATDSIGHRYGPFSQEAMDNHLRLDRDLTGLLDTIDDVVGLDRTVFALSADHGAVPLVEHLVENGLAAERFPTGALWEHARRVADDCGAGPAAETVADSSGTRLYWNESALRERGVDLDRASECVAESLTDYPGVEAALTARQLSIEGGGALETLFENAFVAGRTAHIQVHLHPYLYAGGETGTGHGSAHAYDCRVPVLFAGAGIEPCRHEVAAGPGDIAPTLAAILGVELPPEPGARVLGEALRRESGRWGR